MAGRQTMKAEFLRMSGYELAGFPKTEALKWIGKYVIFKIKKRLWGFENSGEVSDWEMRMYSQNGEDGIIEYIFGRIGIANRYFVELGTGEGNECNSRYLQEKGWTGLGIDGNYKNEFVKNEWITRENVEKLLRKYRVPKEFDLLSIDLDSNDYWIWKAMTNFHPRAVVIEYNSCIPADQSLTIAYDPKFIADGSNYFGASLKALDKLAGVKGYILVGCESRGVNAFFVRADLARGKFAPARVEELYRPPQFGRKIDGRWAGYPASDRKMVEV